MSDVDLQIVRVAETISQLVIPGLEIRDIDDIPAEVGLRDAMLIPKPDYITDFTMTRVSYGGASALVDVTYTLNYRLCYQPVGMERPMTLTVWGGMCSMVAGIWGKFLEIGVFNADHNEVVDVEPLAPLNMGIVNDPAGRAFYGCDLAFKIMEFAR